MNFIFSMIKLTVLTVVVLLVSQIQVNGKRICDHVGDITRSSAVQKPIYYLSDHFDFTSGKARAPKSGSQNRDRAPTR